ncbi:ANK-REP-REGION domain-containing protein [Mycena kentingensis (nom. inval.)]|nr:ANK-REP-REGION domain-containing protein [Mycena kentingensis (nom. inval.)]
MSSTGAVVVPDLRDTEGALYLGVVIAAFLQGMLTVQAFHYFEQYPKDYKILKALVAFLWCLNFAHLGLLIDIPWIRLILNWGDSSVFRRNTKVLSFQLVLVAIPTVLCQSFYLHRLWRFSKRNYALVGVLGCAIWAGFALEIFLAVVTTSSPKAYLNDRPHIIALFSLAAGSDLAIALSLVYYLKCEMGAIRNAVAPASTGYETETRRETNFVLTRVIRYAVGTGLLTSLSAILSLILMLVSPQSRVFMASHVLLGRLYTNALFANLNSRANLRQKLQGPITTSTMLQPPVFTIPSVRADEYALGNVKSGEASTLPAGHVNVGVSVSVVQEYSEIVYDGRNRNGYGQVC